MVLYNADRKGLSAVFCSSARRAHHGGAMGGLFGERLRLETGVLRKQLRGDLESWHQRFVQEWIAN